MSKYHNRKIVTATGLRFDSAAEFERFIVLDDMEARGEIRDLQLQPSFCLQAAFRHNGKTYKAITYRADFMYYRGAQCVVEDVKGVETEVFRIKSKMFIKNYPTVEFVVVRV